MDWLDLVQWPAMAVTVLSGWMVASQAYVEAERGILAISPQQHSMGYLGSS
jgi:hypothetical protein